jgi:hypothetical protein
VPGSPVWVSSGSYSLPCSALPRNFRRYGAGKPTPHGRRSVSDCRGLDERVASIKLKLLVRSLHLSLFRQISEKVGLTPGMSRARFVARRLHALVRPCFCLCFSVHFPLTTTRLPHYSALERATQGTPSSSLTPIAPPRCLRHAMSSAALVPLLDGSWLR